MWGGMGAEAARAAIDTVCDARVRMRGGSLNARVNAFMADRVREVFDKYGIL